MKDKFGVLRGRCTLCSCSEYNSVNGKVKCEDCGHVPVKHERIMDGYNWDSDDTSDNEDPMQAWTEIPITSGSKMASSNNNLTVQVCQVSGCEEMASFDLNTRQYTSPYCHDHHVLVTPNIIQSPMSITGTSLAVLLCAVQCFDCS